MRAVRLAVNGEYARGEDAVRPGDGRFHRDLVAGG
jgi:hypothetical protein